MLLRLREIRLGLCEMLYDSRSTRDASTPFLLGLREIRVGLREMLLGLREMLIGLREMLLGILEMRCC